jgi:hypothetical protein
MSSSFVRTSILSFLGSGSSETLIDLTAEYDDIKDMIKDAGIGVNDPWLGVQFVGADERPVDIGATNTRGKYREEGIIYLHIVDIAKLGVHNGILTRAEALRNLFRGRRINGTVKIIAVSPPNFGEGVTLSFAGGYTAALVQIDYQRDLDL